MAWRKRKRDKSVPSDLEAARARLRGDKPFIAGEKGRRIRPFLAEHWDDLRSFGPVAFGICVLTFAGTSGVAILHSKGRWQWAALALAVVVIAQLVIAYRRYVARHTVEADALDRLIREGMWLKERIAQPSQAWHNPFDPSDPEKGHPAAIRAIDFVHRAHATMSAPYAHALWESVPQAIADYNAEQAEAAILEAKQAKDETRDPAGVPNWPWPVFVSATLRVLADASKDLGRRG